jgi:uncharacterized protein YdaT
MPWTFKKAPFKLQQLKPEVREKAIEIARKLIEEEHWPEEKAINEAIRRAEEWGIDEAG